MQSSNQVADDFVLLDVDVHVWQADLDRPPEEMKTLSASLSADEMDRARRFHFNADRNRFMAARGILRCLLGSYLRVEPLELEFGYGGKGKPGLSCPWAASGLSFNLAHSRQLGIFAFALNRQVGIDIECFREITDIEAIAETNFHIRERAALQTIQAGARRAAFFRCWTRKEAFIKAIGQGLSQPLDRFDVSAMPGAPDRLCPVDHGLGLKWAIWDVPVGSKAAAALAVEGRGLRVTCRQWGTAYEGILAWRAVRRVVCAAAGYDRDRRRSVNG